METRDVTAHDGHLVISTLGKGEKPLKKKKHMLMKHKVSMQQYQSQLSDQKGKIRCLHLLSFPFLVLLFAVMFFSSSDGRTMPLSLCSS